MAPIGPKLDRRGFLAGAVAMSLSSPSQAQGAGGPTVPVGAEDGFEPGEAFSFDELSQIASRASGEAYAAPTMTLSPPFADLGLEQYKGIHFRDDIRPLSGSTGAFALELLPPGLVYLHRVGISIVRPGGVEDVAFAPELFTFDPDLFPFPGGRAPADAGEDLDFTGFRLRHPINSPDVMDEFVVFQGASYFRAIAHDMIFGLAARGLAIATADPHGEEFPLFRHFWIHEPKPEDRFILVHALLDSASATGAFQFEVRPGETTVMETRCRLFPRTEVTQVGIAPLTSMFFFGPERRVGIDDYRDAVHDSAGLQIITGQGTRVWRPLTNPARVEVSAFVDDSPKGFGLSQRPRNFAFYQDAQARYDRRPCCWVEPLDEWGPGAVMLIEIPVANELNDNIVAFWRPQAPLLPAEAGHDFSYRLHWCASPPDVAPLARVESTRIGAASGEPAKRIVVVDFRKPVEGTPVLRGTLSVDRGSASPVELRDLPGGEIVRATFTFDPAGATAAEMQLSLEDDKGERHSELWLFRWTAP